MIEKIISIGLSIVPYLAIPFLVSLVMVFIGDKMMIRHEDLKYKSFLVILLTASALSGSLIHFNFYAMIGMFFIMTWSTTKIYLDIRWRESLIFALSALSIAYLLHFGIGYFDPASMILKSINSDKTEIAEEAEGVQHAASEIGAENNEEKTTRKLPKLPKLPDSTNETE